MKIFAQKKINGFTLIEILIALTLFSMILIMVFTGLHSSSKSWQAADRQVETNDEQRLILDFIRKRVTQTVPLILLDGKENKVLFRGEPEKVQFISSLPAHRGGGGLHLLSLDTKKNEEHSSLTFTYQLVTPEIDFLNESSNEELKSVALIQDVDAVEFSYFGIKEDDKEPSWYESWEEEDRLPQLLRMQILPEDENTFWPELFFAIRSQMERGQTQLTLNKPKRF